MGDTSLHFKGIYSNRLAVEQEHFRRMTVKLFDVLIENSFINNSLIANRPALYDSLPDILYENCQHANVEIFNSKIDTSLVNITALDVSMRMDKLYFTNSHTSEYQKYTSSVGVYIKHGFNLAKNFSTDPNLYISTTRKRKRRWVNKSNRQIFTTDDDEARKIMRSILQKSKSEDSDQENIYILQNLKMTTKMSETDIPRRGQLDKYEIPFQITQLSKPIKMPVFSDNTEKSDKILHRVRRSKANSTSSGTSPLPGLINIKDSTFYGLQQGREISVAAIRIYANNEFDLQIGGCNFTKNERAIEIDVKGNVGKGSVYIYDTSFISNHAYGPGAGLHVYQLAGKLTVRVIRCVFKNNIADSLRQPKKKNDNNTASASQSQSTNITNGTMVAVATNIDVSRITGSGGAIAINLINIENIAHIISIEYSTFVNNTAKNYGGSLYFTPGVSAKLLHNDLYNVDCVETIDKFCRARVGDILESRGSMIMKDNNFTALTASNVIPVVSYRADEDGSFMETDGLSFKCPLGFITSPLYTSVQISSTRTLIETLLLYCKKCTDNYYTIDASEVQINQAQGLNISDVTRATCLPCPYGAQCLSDRNVQAKTNFWGVRSRQKIYMYLCPEGK